MAKVGLWIDYRKTIIVSVMEKWEESKKVVSVPEQYAQHSHDSTIQVGCNPLHAPVNHAFKEIFEDQINTYYDEVIANICDANSILIFGSNTAKYELKHRLEANKLGDRIVGIETVDSMTERQISAKVLQHTVYA
ncbi:MAG: hypothetical protein AUK48_13730 [Oscillatoriales cyanobacterium CG2_30_44_21]|nr:MAG: hypothetical protein AUK48_13730 [Oscillatoriales cyanobacterium CG2_30_44_21]